MYSSVMLKSLLHNLLKQKNSGSGILEKTLYKIPYEFHRSTWLSILWTEYET
jgi:hypothetical protein